jgi:hypothetical protein
MALHYDTILCHLLSNIGLKLTYYFHHTFFASNTYMEDVRVLGAIEFSGESYFGGFDIEHFIGLSECFMKIKMERSKLLPTKLPE